ncbi:MAG: hypothetical protein LUD02_11020 [Tannerellaceae bacterium]|nr:hypothetical protein [Tannerellaceae bacterium]
MTLTSGTPGNTANEPNHTGEVTFKVDTPPNGETSGEATFRFQFYDQGNILTSKYVTINLKSGQSNSGIRDVVLANYYVMRPNRRGIRIPVAQAGRGNPDNPIAPGEKLNYKFIWTDHPGGYTEVSGKPSAVSRLEIEGDGPDAFLIAYPGSEAGNAVVAVTNESGSKIYWSWHLWVSDFNPDDESNDRYNFSVYQFLDRNLGALSEDITQPKSRGLYYQWGRKDPFPMADVNDLSNFVDIFDEFGNVITFRTESSRNVIGTGSTALNNTIQNPLVFYIPSDNSAWYTNEWGSTNENNFQQFWNEFEENSITDANKRIYDPCPDGWKTVPGGTTVAPIWYQIYGGVEYDPVTNSTQVYAEGTVDLGVWPHAGRISGGVLIEPITGRYWTANKEIGGTSDAAHTYFLTSGAAQPGTNIRINDGLTIRCVRRIGD